MSRISTMASLLLSLPLLAGPVVVTTVAHAQQVSITARVPFEFTANNERLAAGIFQIKLVSDRFFCCSIDGRHHYLFQVRIPGRAGYSELLPSRTERQMIDGSRWRLMCSQSLCGGDRN